MLTFWFPVDVDVGQSMRGDANFEAQFHNGAAQRAAGLSGLELSVVDLSAAQEYMSATATAAQWGGGTTLSL